MSGNSTRANEPVLVELTEDFGCYAGPDPSGKHDELMFIYNEIFHFDTYRPAVAGVPDAGSFWTWVPMSACSRSTRRGRNQRPG
jgi:hypothetical protein